MIRKARDKNVEPISKSSSLVTRRHIMECRLKWKKPFNQHIRIFDPQQDHLQFNAKLVVEFSLGYKNKKNI